MIIACPECAGPFELRDDDIAALVQLACPHCRFTMILDFAAANDASLVEAGMRMASGYRSAADYRRAASPQVHVAEVEQAPAHVELPVERTPEVARPVSPPTAVPVAPPASTQPPIAATLPVAVSTAIDEDDDVSETIIRAPPMSPSAITVPPGPPGGGRSTVIGMVPPAARPAARTADADTEPARPRAEALAAAGVPVAIPQDRDEPIGTPPPREPARTEAPVHQPPTSRPAEPRPRLAPTPSRVPVAPPPAAELEPDERPPSGMFGAVILVMLLLLSVGLTVVSVLQKNTPDPRPLLEDLYRQYIKP